MRRTIKQAVTIAGIQLCVCVLFSSRLAHAQLSALTIANFDGEKIQTASGLLLMSIDDEQFGGTSRTQLSLTHPGANASRGALHIAFHVTNDFSAPFAGAWAMLGTEGLATDLSGYRGVRFYARSQSGGTFNVGILQYATPPKRYSASFNAGAEWALTDLPFDAFRQETLPGAAASPSAFVPKDVTSIGFMAPPQRRGQFDLDVDQLELYR